MRSEAPTRVVPEHTLRRDVGDHHRWVGSANGRWGVSVMEVDYADEPCGTRVNGDTLQIADKMAGSDAAVPLTPETKPMNLAFPLEPIIANGEQCVRKIKLVCLLAAIE